MPARKTTSRTKSSTSRTTARKSAGRKTAPRKSVASGSVASGGRTSTASRQKSATKKAAPKVAAKKGAKPSSKSTAKTAAKRSSSGSPSAAEQLREYQRKRDFTKTAEPSGSEKRGASRKKGQLRFVIQKHAASHLHYDLRLEIDGVMKSWAVPKGPSADPTVRRLAMQVEDHPVEYNSFEGTIPAGEYGGGTVMIWDTGTYTVEGAGDRDQNTAAREEYASGDFKVNFHGKRIQGSYALVRTRGGMRGNSNPDKPSWLLIKHRDEDARAQDDFDLTTEYETSAVSGRSMDEIRERGKVYGS